MRHCSVITKNYRNNDILLFCLSEIYKTQLDPTISFLHEPGLSRYSLSLDIAEVFKPIIADRLIFSLLNRNQIQDKHFTQDLEYLHLDENGSKIILVVKLFNYNFTNKKRMLQKWMVDNRYS